jgi:hypothetical protein
MFDNELRERIKWAENRIAKVKDHQIVAGILSGRWKQAASRAALGLPRIDSRPLYVLP